MLKIKMNNYHMYEEIGRGKYSVVYKGRKKKSIDYVAVKSVERGRRKKLMNEVRIFHNLQHPNILRFHNWYETRNHLWIVFEYCPGGDLFKLLEEDKKLPEKTIKKFAFELVEGLSYLHLNGIIYADLKPSNILLNEFSNLKFGDFGLSKKISDLALKNAETNQPEALKDEKQGVPYYMAPELFQDDGVYSFASDFWSLGCLLYEMATGKPPFYTNSLKTLIQMITSDPVPQLADLSFEMNDLIQKLLLKDPLQRPTWFEIKQHPVWLSSSPTYEFKSKHAPYPEQPQFKDFIKQTRGISDLDFYYAQRNKSEQKLGAISHKIDFMRISINVQKNLIEAAADEENVEDEDQNTMSSKVQVQKSQSQGDGNYQTDVTLQSKKMVLNFSEYQQNKTDTADFDSLAQLSQTKIRSEEPGSATARPQIVNSDQQLPQQLQTRQNSAKPDQRRQQTASNTPNMFDKPINVQQNNFMVEKNQAPASDFKQLNTNKSPTALTTPSHLIGQKYQTQTPTSNSSLTKQQTAKNMPTVHQLIQGPPVPISSTPTSNSQRSLNSSSSTKTISGTKLQQPSTLLYQTKSNQQRYASKTEQTHLQSSVLDLWLMSQNQLYPANTMISNTNQQQDQKSSSNSKQLPQKSLDQLLNHSSDAQVKPIIGNKDIEIVPPSPPLNHSQLSFEPWTAEKISQMIDSPSIESHLKEIYTVLAQNATINEKLNTLIYFESIIDNSNVSNRLINSAFVQLLLKLLKSVKSPGVKQRLCSVLGLLVRHSTVIDNELAESDFCITLVEVMEEKSEKVRRRAIAALGEFMFYAGTQLDEENYDSVWDLSQASIDLIVKCLRIGEEDDIVRFYACKTIENICAQSIRAGKKFSTADTLNHLIAIFVANQNQLMRTVAIDSHTSTFLESIRTSAAVALSHICRLQPQLFSVVFEKLSPTLFCNTLTDGAPRVQQAFITMLNMALFQQPQKLYPKLVSILLQQTSFLPSLIKLHEHQSIVIRGKCLLTFLLLFKQDFRWISVVQTQVKFFSMLERAFKDNFKYVQCCLLCLCDGVVEIVPTIFQTIAEELQLQLNHENQMSGSLAQDSGRAASRLNQNQDFNQMINQDVAAQIQRGGNMFQIAQIIDLSANQILRTRIFNPFFIRAIAALLDNTTLLISSQDFDAKVAYEFQNNLLSVTESLASNQKILLNLHEPIISYLLPVLVSKVRINGNDMQLQGSYSLEAQESRFLALKIITDTLIPILNEEQIYSKVQSQTQDQQTQRIEALLQQNLIPLATQLLQETDPAPFYGQRLLSALLDCNFRLVKHIPQSTMILICEFYHSDDSTLNKHTVKILKHIVQVFSCQLIQQKQIVPRTIQLLQVMLLQKQEWFLELLLEINQSILSKLSESMKNTQHSVNNLQLIDEVYTGFDICVKLLASDQLQNVSERASQNLISMLSLYASQDDRVQQRSRQIYFTESHLQYLIAALKIDKKIVQKRVLKCVYWALIQCEYLIQISPAESRQLLQFVESIIQMGPATTSADASLYKTSLEIQKKLREIASTQKTF